jgi:gluconate 5-dehydrogenase
LSVREISVHTVYNIPVRNQFDLTGRTALVTGSTRGIGATLAAAYLDAGARVIVHGRDTERVAVAVDHLRGRSAGGYLAVEGLVFDVTDYDGLRAAVGDFEARSGAIDILVNNAGINRPFDLIELPLEAWELIVSTNLTSCFVLAQQVAAGMIARGRGKIINICSVHNRLVRARVAAYAAAKSGLEGLTQVMCASWAAHGIQANGLAPGFIQTEMTTRLAGDPKFNEWLLSRTPAGRWGTPADLEGTAVWLASSGSDFVNGQVIYVDGGVTAVL